MPFTRSQATAVQSLKPLLLQFGADFDFSLERPDDNGVESLSLPHPTAAAVMTAVHDCAIFLWGDPSLPKVLTWHERPDGEQVCFDKDRDVYMTRDPSTGR